MKGVYFLIAVVLFVACAFVFINEHGKFYEFFDGTNTGAMANSQSPYPSMPGVPGAPPPAFSGAASGSPFTTTSNTTPTPNANDTPQSPGSTTANPAVSTPSQQDMMAYIDAVSLFAMGVGTHGGKNETIAKLSPDDVSYFNTLYGEVAKLTQYAMSPVTFPYTSAQTAQKTKEYTYANQYITVQLPQLPVHTSTMRLFVEGSITPSTSSNSMAGMGPPSSMGPPSMGGMGPPSSMGPPSMGPPSMGGMGPPSSMGPPSMGGMGPPSSMGGMGPPSSMGGMGGMGPSQPPSTISGVTTPAMMGGTLTTSGAPAPPPDASTLANGGMMGGGSMMGGAANVGLTGTIPFNNQSMFGNTTTVTGTAGGQGNQPLSGQFTMNGTPISDFIQPSASSPDMFANGKKDAEMCDASDLQTLIGLIMTFVDSLKSLNTSEPVIVARIQQVEKLLLDLNEMKKSIVKGKLASTQIPIRVGDARKFLKRMSVTSSQLPNLITSPSISPATAAAAAGLKSAAGNMTTLLPGNLLDMAKYLKGSITVNFDGDIYIREQMAQRVDKIVNMLKTQQITSSDAQNILQALTAIQGQLGPANYQATDVFKSSWQPADLGSPSMPPGYMPDVEQLNNASEGGDTTVRPGSDSNSYLKRASAAYAAYSYNDMTSPDYKEKLVNLCANVKKSGLDMGDIGCTNIQNVSPEYGYKGAYLMACNRLKDTWGGSYPQMFGCPTK